MASLNTPEGRCCVRVDYRKKKSENSKITGSSRDMQGELGANQRFVEGEVPEWLLEKVIERGGAVGVSVEPNGDG